MNAVEAWRAMLKADQEMLHARAKLRSAPDGSRERLYDVDLLHAKTAAEEAHAAFDAEVRRSNSGSILPEQDAA